MQRAAMPSPMVMPDRPGQVARALRLVTISVLFGLASGVVSVLSGLAGHSLAVLAVGLGVLADVTGSATLIWRFRTESRRPALADRRERQSAALVALALAVVAAVLVAESAAALAAGTRPAATPVTITAAGISLIVLTPLAIAKRRLGKAMTSQALQGDAALSGIGAATSFLALTALIFSWMLGWWWADRVTALIVGGFAAAEAWRTATRRAAG